MSTATPLSSKDLPRLLENDTRVKVAGVDVDGVLRGKLMSKTKFLSVAEAGFGFCSVIFGWDMHDQTYFRELKISTKENGYRDVIAVPDLSSFRRIPWEDNVPFVLLRFLDPLTGKPVCACPRSLLKTIEDKLETRQMSAKAGGRSPPLPGVVAVVVRDPGQASSRHASLTVPSLSRVRVLPVQSSCRRSIGPGAKLVLHRQVPARKPGELAASPYRGHVRLQLDTPRTQPAVLLRRL